MESQAGHLMTNSDPTWMDEHVHIERAADIHLTALHRAH